MITVVNVGNSTGYDYVGRSHSCGGGPSPLGNPCRIGPDGDRATVIEKFRVWLWDAIQLGRDGVIPEPEITSREAYKKGYNELLRLAAIADSGDLVLGCHCAPSACHADVIQSAIEYINQR